MKLQVNGDKLNLEARLDINGDYIVGASWIADRRMILAGFRLADLLIWVTSKL
jgi:hypothetical protein